MCAKSVYSTISVVQCPPSFTHRPSLLLRTTTKLTHKKLNHHHAHNYTHTHTHRYTERSAMSADADTAHGFRWTVARQYEQPRRRRHCLEYTHTHTNPTIFAEREKMSSTHIKHVQCVAQFC